jgi:ribose-phosphate pyrophosphokinase
MESEMILLNGREVQFGNYPNHETSFITKFSAANLASGDEPNVISFKYENDGDLIKLMFLKKHLETIVLTPCELVIYYMPYSRMDRSEGGSVFTLKYVCQMINEMKFQSVYVIEPHSDVTTALLDNCYPIMVTKTLLDASLNDVQFDLAEDFVVYPDAGAQKRYAKYFGGNVIVAHKERDFETGHIKKLDLLGVPESVGNIVPTRKGHKAIIVDDLCSKGGTFMLTANALKEQGFDEIYLVVAHCEENIFNGDVLKENSPIDKVFTTNSIITKDSFVFDKAQYKDKVEIAEVEELI